MNRLILAAAALLAGCTAVPADLREHGIHVERALKYAPAAATRCIGRHAGSESGAIVTYPLTETGPHGVDISTEAPGESARTIVAIRVRSAGSGSIADVWIVPGAYVAPREFAERLTAGC